MFHDIYDSWFNERSKFYKILHESEYILINEAQFFDKLKEVVISMLNENKRVYLYGLDGDFKQQKFGDILDLIPYCDTIEKLKAKCVKCGNSAIFSKRIKGGDSQVLVGSNVYIPVCRKCFQ